MLLLLGHSFPFGFGLTGVIVPTRPPCFAVPFFEPYWFPHEPHAHFPRDVFIQDVCNSEVYSLARVRLEQGVKTIPAKYIKTLSIESGEYDIASYGWDDFDTPVILSSPQRLYAFAESLQAVRIGHREPLRLRLANSPLLHGSDATTVPNPNTESEGNQFTVLELARFQRNRQMCLNALRACFGSLEQHNRALAVHWLEMTKGSLKSEGILESTD